MGTQVLIQFSDRITDTLQKHRVSGDFGEVPMVPVLQNKQSIIGKSSFRCSLLRKLFQKKKKKYKYFWIEKLKMVMICF